MKDSSVLLTLQNAIEKRSLVSVFFNINNSQHLSAGFIHDISDEQVIIKHISKQGLYDGYVIRRLVDILRVDTNGDYEKRLFSLYNLNDQTHAALLLKSKCIKESNLFKEILISAQELNFAVSLLLNGDDEEDLSGWVKNVNDTVVVLSKISYYGHNDGKTILKLEDIVAIDCDTDDEISLKLLNMSKMKQLSDG